jgi:PAS domain S-box-containing protein
MRHAARRQSTAREDKRRAIKRETARLFAKYAVISLVPVCALGAALAVGVQTGAHQRELAEGKAEALLVAQSAIEPLLSARPITQLDSYEASRLRQVAASAVGGASRDVLALRVRSLAGRIVFADAGSRLASPPGAALEAAHGSTVARLATYNGDTKAGGPSGPAVVEVYEPLISGGQRVGVLEIDLREAPISAQVATSVENPYLGMGIGLALLYLSLLTIIASVSRGLRRQLTLNSLQAERLALSERPHRLLFEHNPQPMLAYERETLRIVAVSDSMIARYGYSREELLSMTIRDLTPSQDLAALDRYLATAHGGTLHGRVSRPWRHQYKDGTMIDVEITSDDLVLDGRACRIVHSLNITESNRAFAELGVARDAAVEASNTKSAFLANVSHEVRTPMSGVIGMTELLLETELTDEQRSYAEQAVRSGEQMMAIINDVLDLSRIEAGQFELDITDFDLRETIEQACSVAGLQAKSKGLALDLQFGKAVPQQARGDGRRIRQILLNLVSNAVKFTAEGTIVVRLDSLAQANGDARLRVEVSDTGIGIDPEALERVFEPFTQADVSTTRNYGGTGLGLAIARELIELMGGTIGAASEPDQGSTFWFEVDLSAPIARSEQPSRPRERLHAVAPRPGSPAPLVLVAEDSPVNQIVAVRALERCGCRAAVANDGAAALDALAKGHFDAVLMDCQMPGVDGYQATAELRRREHAAGEGHTPVIAMTASAMEGDLERCLTAGMDDYISKPMRYHVLVDTLRRWVPALGESVGHAA